MKNVGNDEQESPEFGSRAWKLEKIEERLIPYLDNEAWDEKYNPSQESVTLATKHLAREYHDLADPAAKSVFLLIVLLVLLDSAIYLNSQIYGLFLDIWATMLFVFPSLKGRFVIATSVEGMPEEAIHLLESQEMVSTNAGFVFLAIGFSLQILAVQFISNEEFITTNYFSSVFPGWLTVPVLALIGIVVFRIFNNLRDARLGEREEQPR